MAGKTREAEWLDDAVLADDLLVEVGAEFASALLGFEVDVDDSEALVISVGPLVVIQQAPDEVAFDGDALRDGTVELAEVVAQVHDAVAIVDVAIRGERVGGGGAILGDVEFLRLPEIRSEEHTSELQSL